MTTAVPPDSASILESREQWPDAALNAAISLLRVANGSLTVVDVGAHHGESLESLSSGHGGDLHYVGLEPSPESFGKFESTARKLERPGRKFRCLPCAAGPQDSRATFLVTQASAVSGLLRATPGLEDRVPTGDHKVQKEVEVDVRAVDSLMRAENLERVDLLKIDAEGYDLEVLRGATQSLSSRRIGAVITEVFFVPYREGQAYFWDIASWMQEQGYHFVNLYDTRNTAQGRLYTGNGLWVSPDVATTNGFL